MTAAQYRKALAELGLTPTAAARLLGVDEGTSRRYSSRGVRGAPEILLKLLLTRRIGAERCELRNRRGGSRANHRAALRSVAPGDRGSSKH
jgi:hypothetical protein